ncbi:hypothetical protein [Paraclostridium tenue]|uniref:Uncharacterized protein n=1 Tax=Paraclostridium tenue TaxID=1737 RepID=A0ABN1M5N0_9FIRM
MINNINKNSYNMNPYIKLPTKPNNEEIPTQSKVEDIDVKDFFLKIKEELKNVELIAIKMIKGEPLTPKEQRLITEKYPDIKQLAQQSKKEIKDLKEEIKNCKTEEERQQVISKAIKNIKVIDKKGLLSEVQVKIKMVAVKEVEKFSQKINLESKKSEIIATKIIKGEKLTSDEQKFITEKYPEVKQLAQQLKEEVKVLKEQIKNCKTEEERQQVISKEITNIKVMDKKGLLPKVQVKIKMAAVKEVEKFSQKINLEDKKVEVIATKIIKGEKLTYKEQKLITDKYPEIKQIAQQSKEEVKVLKEQIKNCKTDEEKQQVISKETNNLEEIFQEGIISPVQLKFKMLAIEAIRKENEKENNKLFNINPYVYLNPGAIVDNLTGILMVIVIIIIILYII